jgi:cytochrome P450
VVLTLALIAVELYSRSQKTIPPGSTRPDGPDGKPLVGNLLDIPPIHSWLKFHEWSKEYGPIFSLNIAGQTHVFVSREDIANDLLRERGNIYSDRDQLPMAAQLLSRGLRPLFLPYGETWRNVRKLMHQVANVKIAASYQPLQAQESLRVVHDLIKAPKQYQTWFERFSAGVILRLAYSKPVETGEEPYVRQIMHTVHTVERVASPGAYLVDTFRSLMHLPQALAPFKREGDRLHNLELNLFRNLLHEGVSASQQGETNFCGKWANDKAAYGISDDHAAYAVGTLFEAGAGTTAAAMASFMLAMTLHPTELQLLQAELDDVAGDRLPTFDDMPSLPRVRAVVKETLRWRPVTAGGLPHMLSRDDIYEMKTAKGTTNLFLEAGTNVHPVQWSIHRDATLYPDPEHFRPERWLQDSWPTYKAPLTQFPNLQNFSAFGFGRRICPGQHIAERSLYILVAQIAWACDFGAPVDGQGKAVMPPEYDYISGFNVSGALTSMLFWFWTC